MYEKKLKKSFITGLVIVVLIFAVMINIGFLTSIMTPEGTIAWTNLILFIILTLIIGYVWIQRKRILPKSAKI